MSIGIAKDEMIEAGRQMQSDRELVDKIKPLLDSYRFARDYAKTKMQEYSESEIIFAQFRGKFNVYQQVIADLESLVPNWLKSDIEEVLL